MPAYEAHKCDCRLRARAGVWGLGAGALKHPRNGRNGRASFDRSWNGGRRYSPPPPADGGGIGRRGGPPESICQVMAVGL